MSRFFINDSYYFLTVPTTNHQPFFSGDLKNILLNRIREAKEKFDVVDLDFGIMSNHYHLIGHFNVGNLIPKMLQFINGGVAFELKQKKKISGSVWAEYHVYVAMNELALYKIRGYVIGNPFKHGEVGTVLDLKDYPYSSFSRHVEQDGLEHTLNLVNSVISVDEDQFMIDISETDGTPDIPSHFSGVELNGTEVPLNTDGTEVPEKS